MNERVKEIGRQVARFAYLRGSCEANEFLQRSEKSLVNPGERNAILPQRPREAASAFLPLVIERGWSPSAYEKWLAKILVQTLTEGAVGEYTLVVVRVTSCPERALTAAALLA